MCWWSSVEPDRTLRGSTVTASSSTVLVSTTAYNALTGAVETATDPAGIVTRVAQDDLGRTITVEEADGTAVERIVRNEYNGLNSLTKLTIDLASNDQVTTYLYEDAVDASRQTNAIYPDSTDTTSAGTNQVKLVYNVDGSLASRKDPRVNGSSAQTEIQYTYNERRQLVLDNVTTLGTGVDGAVRSIKREYDTLLARLEKVTSYSAIDGGGTVLNQVVNGYDDFNKLTTQWQSHEGAATTSGMSQSPKVTYAYDDSQDVNSIFDDGYRLSSVSYPGSSRVISYDYGTAAGLDDRLSRLRQQKNGATVLVEYSYNGAAHPVLVDLQVPDVKLDHYQGTSGR
jgi:hypothetical protein